MNTIQLKHSDTQNVLHQFQTVFGGDIAFSDGEHRLEFNNAMSAGKIQGMVFRAGLSYFTIDLLAKEDTTILLKNTDINPLVFSYCSQGHLSHCFGVNGVCRDIECFQTVIIKSEAWQENLLHIRKDVHLKMMFIMVDSERMPINESSLLNENLLSTFTYKDASDNYLYLGSYNLKIMEKIQQLEAITEKGMVKKLLTEGLVHMILALEIQQHSDDLEHVENNTGTLTQREMKKIMEVSDIINKQPETQFTLNMLSEHTGLAQHKLQEGFKLMHDRTVTDYIRDVRITKAEELIKTTDLNISQVVYSIGLTSRSYFSRIFAKKYNCSPRVYKDRYNSVAATA